MQKVKGADGLGRALESMMMPYPPPLLAPIQVFLIALAVLVPGCCPQITRPLMGVCYEPHPSDFTDWAQSGTLPRTGRRQSVVLM